MNLYVMRHAEAKPVGGRIRMDADRTLTALGQQDAIAMGKTLDRLDREIAVVLTSTLARAKQTGEYIVNAMKSSPDLRSTTLLDPGFDHDMLLEEASIAGGNVVVVGHQPDVGMLVSYLTGESTRKVFSMPPAGLVALQRESQLVPFHIQWCLTPDVLRAGLEVTSSGVHR